MADMAPVHLWLVQVLSAELVARGAAFFDGRVLDGDTVPMIPGPAQQVRPHAVLWLGDNSKHPYGQGICGSRDALGLLPFAVLCVANDAYGCTQVRDIVTRVLVGATPPDSGEINDSGSYADQPVPSLLKPARFMRTLGFYVSVGASGASGGI